MKAIIFAGGIGTRMWPYSRKSSPKQFEPIISGQSTLQLAAARLIPDFAWEDIYISSGAQYLNLIKSQLPLIPASNIISEPVMRDVAPAVGYLMSILSLDNPDTPVAILWSDHIVKKVDTFKKALSAAASHLQSHPDSIVFLGQKPRFANQNLGWIEYGDKLESHDGFDFMSFVSWHYRPDLATAKKYYQDNYHAWNPGYFITTPGYLMKKYAEYMPEIHSVLVKLQQTYGTQDHEANLKKLYPTLPKIDFDSAIVEKIPTSEAAVMSVDIGWSDVGTWESLKEALQDHPQDNITQGNVYPYQTTNSIIYSNTDQLVTTIDVDGLVVVVTKDAIMVTKQSSIPEIKKMLKEFEGQDLEKYT